MNLGKDITATPLGVTLSPTFVVAQPITVSGGSITATTMAYGLVPETVKVLDCPGTTETGLITTEIVGGDVLDIGPFRRGACPKSSMNQHGTLELIVDDTNSEISSNF
ncbi:8054_t:CDS:2 [Funneliformis mosseae]|uniref:8054_t:CDS:1 n=1 Tax=Funneliformis mosseae TaxID=27381 RepID=A0A9N9BYQ1_FUNMO|nr:8054_t:CDS:2 [Funneliformis mosseae]